MDSRLQEVQAWIRARVDAGANHTTILDQIEKAVQNYPAAPHTATPDMLRCRGIKSEPDVSPVSANLVSASPVSAITKSTKNNSHEKSPERRRIFAAASTTTSRALAKDGMKLGATPVKVISSPMSDETSPAITRHSKRLAPMEDDQRVDMEGHTGFETTDDKKKIKKKKQ